MSCSIGHTREHSLRRSTSMLMECWSLSLLCDRNTMPPSYNTYGRLERDKKPFTRLRFIGIVFEWFIYYAFGRPRRGPTARTATARYSPHPVSGYVCAYNAKRGTPRAPGPPRDPGASPAEILKPQTGWMPATHSGLGFSGRHRCLQTHMVPGMRAGVVFWLRF